MAKKLHRSVKQKMIAGVCGGLGEYFGVDPVIVRIVFVLFTLGYGGGAVLYLLLWLIMPKNGSVDSVQEGVEEMRESGKKLAEKLRRKK